MPQYIDLAFRRGLALGPRCSYIGVPHVTRAKESKHQTSFELLRRWRHHCLGWASCFTIAFGSSCDNGWLAVLMKGREGRRRYEFNDAKIENCAEVIHDGESW